MLHFPEIGLMKISKISQIQIIITKYYNFPIKVIHWITKLMPVMFKDQETQT